MRRLTTLAAALVCSGFSIPALAENGAGAIADSYNASGAAVFQAVAGAGGNAVLSPLGIGTAMAMAALGASGETADEMSAVLGLPADPGILAEEAGVFVAEDGDALRLTNALHLTRHGDVVAASYRALLADRFGAEIFEGSDADAINAWVADKTDGRIDRLIDRLSPNSVAMILNAVQFQADWARPFKASATGPAPFRLASGESVEVETMRRTGTYRILRGAEVLAVALPYAGERYQMIVTLPSDPAAAVLPPGPAALAEVLAGLVAVEPARVGLSLPKVEMVFEADLIPGFQSIGLDRPFDAARAEFGGITGAGAGEDRLYIDQVRHKAFLAIDEEGTEAAAATGVGIGLTSAAPPAEEIRIDRPFGFVILDGATGAVLFLGRVSDPR